MEISTWDTVDQLAKQQHFAVPLSFNQIKNMLSDLYDIMDQWEAEKSGHGTIWHQEGIVGTYDV